MNGSSTLDETFALALRRHESGQLAEAERLYRQVLASEPNHARALYSFGLLAHQCSQNDQAVKLMQRAVALAPQNGVYLANLALVLRALGRRDEAIACLQKARNLGPASCEIENNLGNLLREAGRLDEAIASYRRALAAKPDYPEAHNNLANVLAKKGHLAESIAHYLKAIELRPDYFEAHSNMGNALIAEGRQGEAIASYEKALRLRPDSPDVYNNLGNAWREKRESDQAVACYRKALALKPGYAEAHYNLGNALKDKGEMEQAIAGYRRAVELRPNDREAYSNLVYSLHCLPGCGAQAIWREHQQWNRQQARPLASLLRPHTNTPDLDRPLRIGYVSGDFYQHAVSRFALPLLSHHDHRHFHVSCYMTQDKEDAVTRRFKGCCDRWQSLVNCSDEQAAEIIRQDQIDILIDLSGHTAGNRLLMFARKPAPIHVTYLGYPNTTGLETIDYRFTDGLADPVGDVSESWHSEKLVRLPKTAWCFEPAADAPPVSTPPAGKLTFGSFNNYSKLNEPLLRLWGRILRAVPGSRLLVKAAPLDQASCRQQFQETMEQEGIPAHRLELRSWEISAACHLSLYDQVDIGLDTYPYHGTTTTCEALWQGVPVVTLAGESHVSRVGVSLLSNVGLTDLVAQTEEQYVRIAVALADDRSRLAELRRTLRSRMEGSPLMDAAEFARDVEAAYRAMWGKWCAEHKS